MVAKQLNPKIHDFAQNIGSPNSRGPGGRLLKGRIVTEAPMKGGKSGALVFMYNPGEISVEHNALSSVANTNNQDFNSGGDNSAYDVGMIQQGSVSLDLYFDRTYEMAQRNPSGNVAHKIGCYADVLAIYQMAGMIDSSAHFTLPKGAGPDISNIASWPTAPFVPNTMVYAYVGSPTGFYGALSSLSITYSHFTYDLVPVRCVISVGITFQTTPLGKAADTVVIGSQLTPGLGGFTGGGLNGALPR